MTAQYFIDTNILLYAGSGAGEDQAKKAIARQVLAQTDIGFSAQVMQEFYHAAVRKERLKITHDEAVQILEALSPFPVLAVDREMVLELSS
jgi:predicted nucleic acid-binding protein